MKHCLALRSEERDEGHGDRLLLVSELIGQLFKVLQVGFVEAILNPHERAFNPLVLISEGAFIEGVSRWIGAGLVAVGIVEPFKSTGDGVLCVRLFVECTGYAVPRNQLVVAL